MIDGYFWGSSVFVSFEIIQVYHVWDDFFSPYWASWLEADHTQMADLNNKIGELI